MWDPDEFVTLLYIDNSNIFISAQKYSATKKNFLPGVQDTRCRLDMRKMIAMALGTRTLDKDAGNAYSYVSEPPPFPQEMQKAIREAGVGIKIFERNAMSKEKEVDTTLTADAVEKIVLEREKKDKLIILFTGDRDMKPVVDKAEKYEWKINLWSFNEHLAREYEKLKCLQIFRMKSYFDQVTFIETRWKKKIPEERSLTLTFSGQPPGVSFTELCDTLADEVVEKCTELLRVPCQGRFIDAVHFALVICLQENYTNGDQIKNFYNFNDLIGSSPSRSSSSSTSTSTSTVSPGGGRKQPEMFSTMRGACSKILAGKNPNYSCTLVETFTTFRQRLKFSQMNGSIALTNKYTILNSTAQNGNGDGRKFKGSRKIFNGHNSTTTANQNGRCNGNSTSGNQNEGGYHDNNYQEDEDDSLEGDEAPHSKNILSKLWLLHFLLNYVWSLCQIFINFFKLIFTHKQIDHLTSKNLIQFPTEENDGDGADGDAAQFENYDNENDTDDLELTKERHFDSKLITKNSPKQNQNESDDDDDDHSLYEVVRGRQPKKSYRKYSKFCEYKFTCEKYPKCHCSHSVQEEEYFSVHRDVKPEMRRLYKTVECNRYKKMEGGGGVGGARCKFLAKSYLCPFAHGTKEARCVSCHVDGLHFSGHCTGTNTTSNFKSRSSMGKYRT